MPGHLLIVLGAPQLLGDLLTRAFASEPEVRLVVAPHGDPLAALAEHPAATVVVLDDGGAAGVVWRRAESPSPLEPVSLRSLLDAARRN